MNGCIKELDPWEKLKTRCEHLTNYTRNTLIIQ